MYIVVMKMAYHLIYGINAAKRRFFKFSNYFQFSMRYLGPLQLLSYALEVGLFRMELQWPQFCNILIAHINFDVPFWKITRFLLSCMYKVIQMLCVRIGKTF